MGAALYRALDIATDRFPRIRGDVVFLEVDSGAYFRSADETILLRGPSAYQLASIVVRSLTGEHSVAEIVDGLGEAQRQSVMHVITTLHDKGMVRLSSSRRDAGADFDAQLAYVEHFAGDDADAFAMFARFRDARVLVAGGTGSVSVVAGLLVNGARHVTVESDDPDFAASLDEVLEAIGTPSGVADVRVVAPGTTRGAQDCIVFDAPLDRIRELARLTEELATTNSDVTLVPIVRTADTATVGPVWRPGSRGCWACVQMRVATNSGGTEPTVVRALAFGAPARPVHEPSLAMIGNEAAFAVFRARTRSDAGELERTVLIQQFETLESRIRRVVPHPECPYCASGTPPLRTDAGGRDRVDASAVLTDPVTGVLTRWTDDDIEQVPVKTGRIEYFVDGAHGPERRSATGHDLDDVLAARDRALDRAVIDLAARRPCSAVAGDGAIVVPPEELDGTRSDCPVLSGATVAAFRLDGAGPVAVPVEAVTRNAPDGAYVSTSLGLGWGTDQNGATEIAVRSALALRGLEAALRGSAPAVLLELGAGEDAAFLIRSLRHLSIAPRLLVLPGARPTTAVVAFEADQTDGVWTLGVADDPEHAAVTALRDLLGARIAGTVEEPIWRASHPALFRLADEVVTEDTAPADADAWTAVRRSAVFVDVTPPDLAPLGGRIHRVLLGRDLAVEG